MNFNLMNVIAVYILIACLVMLLVAAFYMRPVKNSTERTVEIETMVYIGTLWNAKDQQQDVYRNRYTGKTYYKHGLQYRSTETGRIVKTSEAEKRFILLGA